MNYFRDAKYLPTLDGWRAIAIVLVSLAHLSLGNASGRTRNIFSMGYLGVWIFFSISGLLICTRLLNAEERTGSLSLRTFYLHRFYRIQPAALTFLAMLLGLAVMGYIHLNHKMFAGALFQVEDYVDYFQRGRPDNWYARHFWSLSVEEHFYLILPALLLAAKRYRLRIFAVVLSLCLCWSYFGSKMAVAAQREAIHRTDLIIGCLLIPAMLAIWIRRGEIAQSFRPYTFWIGVAMMAALVGTSHQTHILWVNLQITLPVATSMMIIGTVQNPQMMISRIFEWKPLRFVGKLSYSFYLYQQFFFIHGTPHAEGWAGKLQVFPLVIIGPIVAAIASYYLIERPTIRWAHRRFPNDRKTLASLKQSV